MMSEKVHANSYLTLHYRVTFASGVAQGKVFIDTFVDKPATLQLGQGQWISAMEAPLIGHQVGDKFSYLVKQEFGQHNPNLVQRVSRKTLEEHDQTEEPQYIIGEMMQFNADDGASYAGIISAVDQDWVELDFNHPFAGKDLQIDVHILGIL